MHESYIIIIAPIGLMSRAANKERKTGSVGKMKNKKGLA